MKYSLVALILPTVVLCGAANAYVATPQEIDIGAVSEDKIAIIDVSDSAKAGKSFMAATIINAPVPKLCSIILNFSDYPSFMPNTDKTVVVRSANDISLVDMTLKLPLGKIKKYRLQMEAKPNSLSCQLAWKLIPREDLKPEETIADTSGYWKLVPSSSDAGKTLVKYFVYSDPGPVPYGLGWIVDSLGKDSLPKTLEALRIRAAIGHK